MLYIVSKNTDTQSLINNVQVPKGFTINQTREADYPKG